MKTLMILALAASANAYSQARYCDAVVTASAHDWGVEMNVTSTASEGTDCFFSIAVRPAHADQSTKLTWVLSRVEASPARFLTDCSAIGVQLNCGIGLKPGATATILGVRRQREANGSTTQCYWASAQNITFFSGAAGLQQRPGRLICLPE